MKTNQILTRQMGTFEVQQRTSDGMFNATILLKQWNESGRNKKDLDDFLNNKSTKEYIKVIENKEIDNTHDSGDLKIYKSARGKNGGTWMHPFLFIDFAMWLNAEFKYEVIKFVYDQLLKYRNEAGDSYQKMTSQIGKLVRKEFLSGAIQTVAKYNNHIVYGRHERNIRNSKAEESSMIELSKLQVKIAELIEDGFINDFDSLIKYLKSTWTKKYQPKISA